MFGRDAAPPPSAILFKGRKNPLNIGTSHASHRERSVVMQTKDYIYLGLITVTAAVFYWHGYLAARSRARKSFAAIFNDRRTVVEMPASEQEQEEATTTRAMRPAPALRRRSTKIRAVFGIN
jgi:hypothetical protein